VETDLGLGDILQLAVYAPKMTNADIRSYYIRPPYVSSWITESGAYVLLPNEAALQGLLTEAMSPATQIVEKQSIVIDVMNGTTITGYETLAAERLNYAGYETHIVPSDRADYAYSVLIISSPDANRKANYTLIIGYDYEPFFAP
jgi:hypothetical protein